MESGQPSVLKHEWEHIREQGKEWWTDLTDADLEEIRGDRPKPVALLIRKRGYSRERAERERDRRLSDYIRFAR